MKVNTITTNQNTIKYNKTPKNIPFRATTAADESMLTTTSQDTTQFNRKLAVPESAGSLITKPTRNFFSKVGKAIESFFNPPMHELDYMGEINDDNIDRYVALRRYYV